MPSNEVQTMSDAVDRAPAGMDRRRLGSILRNSVGDPMYLHALMAMSDEELRYCADHEYRKSGQALITREMRRRIRAKQGTQR